MPKKKGALPKANATQWCFAWVPPAKGRTRLAMLKEARWPDEIAQLRVGFLDGNSGLHERVAKAARGWTVPGLAAKTLVFVGKSDLPKCHIRISFRHRGSWSVIGIHAGRIPIDQPTMNFGWLKADTSDDALNRVVLHEFGHALGLIHEHQNPRGTIAWNKDLIYKELAGPPNKWSKKTIDENMFDTFPANAVDASVLDHTSIMMYPFPSRWTTDGTSTPLNSSLSAQDKKTIRALYP